MLQKLPSSSCWQCPGTPRAAGICSHSPSCGIRAQLLDQPGSGPAGVSEPSLAVRAGPAGSEPHLGPAGVSEPTLDQQEFLSPPWLSGLAEAGMLEGRKQCFSWVGRGQCASSHAPPLSRAGTGKAQCEPVLPSWVLIHTNLHALQDTHP